MGNLTNKQFDILVDIIRDRVIEEQDKIKASEEFQKELQTVIEDHPIKKMLDELKVRDKEIKHLEEKLDEKKTERSRLVHDISEKIGRGYFHRGQFEKALEKKVAESIFEDMNLRKPTKRDAEKLIFLHQNKDAEEIVEIVTSKLLSKE